MSLKSFAVAIVTATFLASSIPVLAADDAAAAATDAKEKGEKHMKGAHAKAKDAKEKAEQAAEAGEGAKGKGKGKMRGRGKGVGNCDSPPCGKGPDKPE